MRGRFALAVHGQQKFHLGVVVALVAEVHHKRLFGRHVAVCVERVAERHVGVLDGHKRGFLGIHLQVQADLVAGVSPCAQQAGRHLDGFARVHLAVHTRVAIHLVVHLETGEEHLRFALYVGHQPREIAVQVGQVGHQHVVRSTILHHHQGRNGPGKQRCRHGRAAIDGIFSTGHRADNQRARRLHLVVDAKHGCRVFHPAHLQTDVTTRVDRAVRIVVAERRQVSESIPGRLRTKHAIIGSRIRQSAHKKIINLLTVISGRGHKHRGDVGILQRLHFRFRKATSPKTHADDIGAPSGGIVDAFHDGGHIAPSIVVHHLDRHNQCARVGADDAQPIIRRSGNAGAVGAMAVSVVHFVVVVHEVPPVDVVHKAVSIVVIAVLSPGLEFVGPNVVLQIGMGDVHAGIQDGNDRPFVVDNRFVPQRIDVERLYPPLLPIQRILPRVGADHLARAIGRKRRHGRHGLHRSPFGQESVDVHMVVRLGPLHLVEGGQFLHEHTNGIGTFRLNLYVINLVEVVLLHHRTVWSLRPAERGAMLLCRKQFVHPCCAVSDKHIVDGSPRRRLEASLACPSNRHRRSVLELHQHLTCYKIVFPGVLNTIYPPPHSHGSPEAAALARQLYPPPWRAT